MPYVPTSEYNSLLLIHAKHQELLQEVQLLKGCDQHFSDIHQLLSKLNSTNTDSFSCYSEIGKTKQLRVIETLVETHSKHKSHVEDLQSLIQDLRAELKETHNLRREADEAKFAAQDEVQLLRQQLCSAQDQLHDQDQRLRSECWTKDELEEENAHLKSALNSALKLLGSMPSIYGGE